MQRPTWIDPAVPELADLSADQHQVTQRLSEEVGFAFVTGKAGTGKSTLLRHLAGRLGGVAVVAPTGIAALNVGGQTIHSLFRLPLGPLERSRDSVHVFNRGHPKRRLLEQLQVLIIDEVSMVRADVLDAIDLSMRLNTNIDQPFGGKKIVAFGDLWQLEPVVQDGADRSMVVDRFKSAFFFDAEVFGETKLRVLELVTPFRQHDDMRFLEALDLLRRGNPDALEYLNTRHGAELNGPTPITLTATNARAQAINMQELNALPGVAQSYIAKSDGTFGRDLPTDQALVLKAGAQVMFVRNADEYVNGTLGVVRETPPGEVVVELNDGKTVRTEPAVWERRSYTWDPDRRRIAQEIVGTYTQIPLKPAWAITVHKSQGLTFDQIVVDFDRPAFAHGQAYVALSRCRTLAGVSLVKPLTPRSLVVNRRIHEFEWDHGLGPE